MIFKECNKPGCKHFHEDVCVGFVTHKEFSCPLDKIYSIDISENEKMAIQALIDCCFGDDVEDNHATADRFLCGFLQDLGYRNIVEVYDLIEKWYT